MDFNLNFLKIAKLCQFPQNLCQNQPFLNFPFFEKNLEKTVKVSNKFKKPTLSLKAQSYHKGMLKEERGPKRIKLYPVYEQTERPIIKKTAKHHLPVSASLGKFNFALRCAALHFLQRKLEFHRV